MIYIHTPICAQACICLRKSSRRRGAKIPWYSLLQRWFWEKNNHPNNDKLIYIFSFSSRRKTSIKTWWRARRPPTSRVSFYQGSRLGEDPTLPGKAEGSGGCFWELHSPAIPKHLLGNDGHEHQRTKRANPASAAAQEKLLLFRWSQN